MITGLGRPRRDGNHDGDEFGDPMIKIEYMRIRQDASDVRTPGPGDAAIRPLSSH